jgi:hypothetical protein
MPTSKLLTGNASEVAGASSPLAGEKENWRMAPASVKKKRLPRASMAGRLAASVPAAATQAAGPSGRSVLGWKPTSREQVAFWAPISSCEAALIHPSRAPPHAAGYATAATSTAMVAVLMRRMAVVPLLIANRDPPLWGAWIKYEALQELIEAVLAPPEHASEKARTGCAPPQNCT